VTLNPRTVTWKDNEFLIVPAGAVLQAIWVFVSISTAHAYNPGLAIGPYVTTAPDAMTPKPLPSNSTTSVPSS